MKNIVESALLYEVKCYIMKTNYPGWLLVLVEHVQSGDPFGWQIFHCPSVIDLTALEEITLWVCMKSPPHEDSFQASFIILQFEKYLTALTAYPTI